MADRAVNLETVIGMVNTYFRNVLNLNPDLLIDGIVSLPTVDAVPVVRCKDCMHYGVTDNRIPEEQIWWCYFWDDVRSPDAYCSDGEREDSEHEKAD